MVVDVGSMNILISVTDKFSKEFEKAESRMKKFGKAAKIAAVATAGLFALAVRNAAKQEKVEAKLLALMKNVRTERRKNIDALKEQAGALQRLTGIGDEMILNAQAQLATFQQNSDAIMVLTPRLLDMAASLEKTSGSTQDLESISIAMGKALTGTAGALTRYGVVLTDAEKDQFNMATGMEKVNLLAKILDSNYRGAAEAVGTTLAGAMNIMKGELGDLTETLAKEGGLLDLVNSIATGISNLAKSFNDLSPPVKALISKGVVGVGGLVIGAGVAVKGAEALKAFRGQTPALPMYTFETNPTAGGLGRAGAVAGAGIAAGLGAGAAIAITAGAVSVVTAQALVGFAEARGDIKKTENIIDKTIANTELLNTELLNTISGFEKAEEGAVKLTESQDELAVSSAEASGAVDETAKSLGNFAVELSIAQKLFKETGIVAASGREAEILRELEAKGVAITPEQYAAQQAAQQPMDDFIMRPGQAPVPFSPNDTIVGTQGNTFGNINVTIHGGNISDPSTFAVEFSKELRRELRTF